jgi:dihydroorotate dehydrogenase (fumarate)
MPGASPLVDDLGLVRRLEDAGASAIVMHSLFEEQIKGEQLASIYHMELYSDCYAEALSYFPRGNEFALGPEEYLNQLGRIKDAVDVPVIASLNGTTRSGWIDYARRIQQAGADALELNVYHVPTDAAESGDSVEQRIVDVAATIVSTISIPVAIKLSPYFTALPNLVFRLETVGIKGFVLFNRFYQPELDLEQLQADPRLQLSDPSELRLRLQWLAILSSQSRSSFAVSGGVHSAGGALKAIACGASAVQVVSALLKRGPEYLATMLEEMKQWLEEHEYHSLAQLHASMNLSGCPDPEAYQRGNYMRMLQTWRGSDEFEAIR